MTLGKIALFLIQMFLMLILMLRTENSSVEASLSQESFSMSARDLCKEVLEKLSNSSSFTKCVTKNAKPIFMCRNCVRDFIDVKTYYAALETSQSKGFNCKDLLTSQDKMEIIKTTVDHILSDTGLWAKGFCSYCYTSPLNYNSSLTENTKTFFALHQQVRDCFEENPSTYKTETGRSEACTDCAEEYKNLLSFYKETFISGNKGFPYRDCVCFDILDTMNTTQQIWGTGRYHCGRRKKVTLPLIAAVVVVLVTPITFYLLACACQERAHERLVTQHHINNILTRAQPPGFYIDNTAEVQNIAQYGSEVENILVTSSSRPTIGEKLFKLTEG